MRPVWRRPSTRRPTTGASAIVFGRLEGGASAFFFCFVTAILALGFLAYGAGDLATEPDPSYLRRSYDETYRSR
jgi:hypothetical protein